MKNDDEVIRAYSMGVTSAEGKRIMLNVRITHLLGIEIKMIGWL